MSKRKRLPLLLGHFGGNNAGDEAILDGTCHLLAECGVHAVRLVARADGYQPTTTAPVEIEVVGAAVPAVVAALRVSSCVVLCGGTHFEDDFRPARRLRHYRYLALYLVVLAVGRAMGRSIVAIGQGLGPLRHPLGRVLTRALLALVPAGTLRDDASFARAQGLGGRAGRWSRTFDTAVAVGHRARAVDAPRDALAIAPVRHADPLLWEACADAIGVTWSGLGLDRIDLVALRSGTREDDLAATQALAARVGAIAPTRTTVFQGDVDVLVDTLAGARVALCGRYHALILSVLAGAVPIVLPVHPKLVDAAEVLGVPEALIVRHVSAAALAAALRAAVDFDARKLWPTLDDLRELLTRDRALLDDAAAPS